jgi:penicillin-binding protein 1A
MTDGLRPYWRLAALTCLACLAFVIGSRFYQFCRELDRTAAAFRLDSGPQQTLLYDRNGRLLFTLHDEQRTDRRLNELAPSVEPAVLSAEDRHFRLHPGIDPLRIAAAAWHDLKAWRITQGASTITQQLVRLQALGRERTWSRKWREALLALRIERRFTKDQILETYLNRIYLGDGYFGIQAAARGYFDKDAGELDTAESAMLAGIIPCPSSCSPRARPERAHSRRNMVLRAMARTGRLPVERLDTALAASTPIQDKQPNTLLPEHEDAHDASGLYFIDAVRRQLVNRFGEGAVLRSGLRVYTTFDADLQSIAEEIVTARVGELETQDNARRRTADVNRIEGSLVAIHPRTGHVLALVGGRDFHDTPYNRAVQARRQPGSAFKPILFAAALELGYAPNAVIDRLDVPIDSAEGAWLPKGEHEASAYTLRRALMVSSNRAAARLLQMVGLTTALYYARQLGLPASMPSVPSLALGTGEVSLIDLTSAYGAFANDGILVPHTLITRVEDALGDVLWQPSRPAIRAVRPTTAFLMSSMLADALNRGTGTGVRAAGFKLPAAGKTGTTDSFADAWFIGYTPSLVTGVWFGRDHPHQIVNRGFAATVAVPAWARFMKRATAGAKPEWFPVPGDLERVAVCEESGLRATPACHHTSSRRMGGVLLEYFLRGKAPKDPCPLHIIDDRLPGLVDRPAAPVLIDRALPGIEEQRGLPSERPLPGRMDHRATPPSGPIAEPVAP